MHILQSRDLRLTLCQTFRDAVEAAVDSIPGQFARAAIFRGPPLLRLQQRASLAGAALLLASILVSTPAAAAHTSQDEQTGVQHY